MRKYHICSRNLRPPRILRTLIFKGGFWIYFSSAYFTHHRIVHLPVICVLIDYRLLNRQWYIQCIHYDYNKFNQDFVMKRGGVTPPMSTFCKETLGICIPPLSPL